MAFERTKAHNRGLAIGAAILSLFGLAWSLGAVFAGPRPIRLYAYTPVPIAFALIVASLWCAIRARGRVAADPRAAAEEGRRAGMLFGLIFVLEGALIAIAAIVLARYNLSPWIPVAVGFIVGLHFLPLARLFRTPLYYFTGILAAGSALVSVALADAVLRIVFVSFAMAAILWITAIAALIQVRLNRS